MLTQQNLIQDQRGYTVTVSTTHQTHAGALAHFTDLLADFTRDHHHAAAIRAAQAAAAAGDTLAAGPASLPDVATTAEADERTAPPASPPFSFSNPRPRRNGDEEPPF